MLMVMGNCYGQMGINNGKLYLLLRTATRAWK